MVDKYKRVLPWGVAVLAVHTLAYFPVWKSLLKAWEQSEDYSHAFFIVPLSIYLVWDKRRSLEVIDIQQSWTGLFIAFFSTMMYWLGTFAGVFTINSLALVFSIIGVTYGLYGPRMIREVWFPLFFLFLMIPIPSQLYWAATTPLQLIVTKVSVFLLRIFSDIPIFRDGNVIHLPEKTLQVVAACSGMRSMISLATLSLIFGYITLRGFWTISTLVVAALPIAIFINILRIISMIISDYYFNFDLSSGNPHTVLGMIVFAIALVMTLSLQKILTRIE